MLTIQPNVKDKVNDKANEKEKENEKEKVKANNRYNHKDKHYLGHANRQVKELFESSKVHLASWLDSKILLISKKFFFYSQV